jgi:tetratricopeptide (TPR) repeat protein
MIFQQLSSGTLFSSRERRSPILRLSRLVMAALVAILVSAPAVWSQARPNRPALIRDTDKAEGKDEAASKEKSYNPMEAEKSVKVGNFYFKKKNYAAAIQRYLEALEYQPSLIVAYEALARAYEKNGNNEKALQVYRDCIQKNPSSTKVSEFQSRISRLEKKIDN